MSNTSMHKCVICGNEYEGESCLFCGYSPSQTIEPQFLEAGVRLNNGRYVVSYAVGAGGFGITYSAWDTLLKQRIAIKEYLPGEFSTRVKGAFNVTIYGGEKSEQFGEGLDKFVEESRKLAKFGEVPGIVQIYDSFQENNTAYIVMEYLDGETLGNRVKREGKLTPDETINIMTPILEALSAVHKEGIIHRDIAPNNILLCKDGRVKLLDFGAARNATGTHSKSLTVLYKEGFTPEEQYSSRGNQGPWTDVYATAATMYYAITGLVPEGAMSRRVSDTLKEPSRLGVKISDSIENAIMNALNVDYKARTASADEFNAQLHSTEAVKRFFTRTKTKKVGRIPKRVWIPASLIVSIAAVLLILLRVGVIDFYSTPFANLFLEPGQVRVINLINMREEDALSRMEKLGLGIHVSDTVYSNSVAEGRIISQEISKGTIVDTGTTVSIVVSKGAETVTVPALVNYKWTDKESVLNELHLKYDVIEESSIFAPGYIFETSPTEGEAILQGDKITVYVSTGMDEIPDNSDVVDNLMGMNIEDARNLLANKKIYIAIEGMEYDDIIPKNLITKQSISGGDSIQCGGTVYVTMSLGIEQKEVPDVTGLTEEEAIKALEDLSLTATAKTVVNREEEERKVIAQSIAANTVVDKYTEVEIDVISHGYEIPSLAGKTQAEAESICRENGFNCIVEHVLGGNGQVRLQSPSAGEIVDTPGTITLQIGIPESEFTQELMSAINSQRQANGHKSLSLDSALSAAAKDLADTGYESIKFQSEGYDFTWVKSKWEIPQSYTFWATRNNITTVSNAISRLPWTANALSRPSITTVGVAYYGTRIVMLLTDQ